jgi:hypothetical protein
VEAARLSEHVWRTTGGNPFVVIEAMRAAAHEALSPGLEGLSLPERVRESHGLERGNPTGSRVSRQSWSGSRSMLS